MMKIFYALMIAATLNFIAPVSTAFAHHGWGGYSTDLDMVGTIVEVDLGNPHDILIVEDDAGEKWQLLLAPPLRNRRFGFGPGSVAAGQKVKLIGERHPQKREAKIHQIWRDDVMVYEYKYGNGRTSLERQKRRR